MPPKKGVSVPKKAPKKDEEEEKKPKSQGKQKTLDGDVAVDKDPPKKKGKQHKVGDQIVGKSAAHRWKIGLGVLPNEVKISSWNVNGFMSVTEKGKLADYVKSFKPDIICLNETKIDEEKFDKNQPKLEDYHHYWNFCKVSKGYSGVAVFSKVEPISVVEDLPQP